MAAKFSGVFLAVTLLAWALCAWPAAGQEDQGARLAKQTVEDFTRRVLANDAAGVRKLADVPFYFNAGKPGEGILLRDRKELDAKLTDIVANTRKVKQKIAYEVEEVLGYARFVAMFGAEIPEVEKKMVEEAVGKTGYLLRVQVKDEAGQKIAGLILMVALRPGAARVVGIRD